MPKSVNCSAPPWFIFHVPHDSTWIPDAVRPQFALSGDELSEELLKMTDHFTAELFTRNIPPEQVVCSEVSRLVVDVERFDDDNQEEMANVGMGTVYTKTHKSKDLRRPITTAERDKLIRKWYIPHHDALTNKVEQVLTRFGQCLILDCHSFSSSPLPHEPDQLPNRPDFCIGTDAFHTPEAVADSLTHSFQLARYTALKNSPFSGALVPIKHYQRDSRVNGVMIEVNRKLYMNELNGNKTPHFDEIAIVIRQAILKIDSTHTLNT